LVNLATAFLAVIVLGPVRGASWKRWWRWRCWRPIVAARGQRRAQTMTGAVRALATRELGSNNALRVIMREALVGLVNGWRFSINHRRCRGGLVQDPPDLAVVIGPGGSFAISLPGALGGILISRMVLERVRADRAVVRVRFVTTIHRRGRFLSFLGTRRFGSG